MIFTIDDPRCVPCGLYETLKICDLVDQHGNEYDVIIGLDRDLASQLQSYACDLSDGALQSNTSDHKRFCEADYEVDFAYKKRLYFALRDRVSGDLAAVTWFAPRSLPLEAYDAAAVGQLWQTVSFRSYGSYRGVGVMSRFAQSVFAFTDQILRYDKIWLRVKSDNQPAIALYKKLGFEKSGDDKRGVVMVRAE